MNYLVIGYGNSLRSDDGAGQKVAQTVAQWKLDHVSALGVHQLTPELAANLAEVDTVFFVDAVPITTPETATLKIEKLALKTSQEKLGHHSNPAYLLSLVQQLYQHNLDAYWVLIPAINFDFGEEFSPITTQGIKEAIAKIKNLITSPKNVTKIMIL